MCWAFLPFVRRLAWAGLVFFVCACNWQPTAKPIQPERVLKGSVRIDRTLDDAQRFALITRNPAGKSRRAIVEWKTKKVCDLPKGVVDIDSPLVDPNGAGDDAPQFLIPLMVDEGEVDRQLYYADEECNLRGPYGRASHTTGITLDETMQQVSLTGNGKGTLRLINPWTDEVTHLAEGVTTYTSVKRPSDGQEELGPQALWIIENGVLRQRTIEGKLLFSRGENVRTFEQALYDTLRVAYVDGNDLYEAAGPDFVPVLIAEDACEPFYAGIDLNLYTPCADRQLVRIDLTTGETIQFDPGVVWSYEQAGFLLEYVEDDEGLHMFVTPPAAERAEVKPAFVDNVQVVDSQRLVGRTQDSEFGLWDARFGYTPLVERAARPLPFVDTRTSELLWLFLHDIGDRRGTLSLFSQTDFSREIVAEGVPTSGYTVELLVQISEPTIVMMEDTKPVSADDSRLRGRLRARLLSGELGSDIDENVTSYTSVYTPLPGLLYSVEDGPRSGLWFAAL
jgi:hypothetical protein